MVFDVPGCIDNREGWGPPDEPPADLVESLPPFFDAFERTGRLGKAADWQAEARFRGVVPRGEDDTFQTVSTKVIAPKGQNWRGGFRGGRYQKVSSALVRKDQENTTTRRGFQPRDRRGWYGRDRIAERASAFKESSVDVKPEWEVVDQIAFAGLQKLTVDNIPEAKEILSAGAVGAYDKTYDRITTKQPKPLQRYESVVFHNVTTSDDPVIQQLAESNKGQVYATDQILSILMAAPRSVYSWDLVARRVGDKLFLDKRPGSRVDLLTVCENGSEIALPAADDKTGEGINSPGSISREATMINQNFSQQVLAAGVENGHDFGRPNPFATEGEQVASVGYRYRMWEIGGVKIVARCEVDGILKDSTVAPSAEAAEAREAAGPQFLSVRALNEIDPKYAGTDWRTKLESQRGSVMATEIRNNASKVARWASQALLSGVAQIKLGFVTRIHPRDPYRHSILAVQLYRPKEFATRINFNFSNGWGVLKKVLDILLANPEGKYLILKDPANPVVRIYRVPDDTFEPSEDEGNPEDDDGPVE
eukprot:tig00000142_g8639.t1